MSADDKRQRSWIRPRTVFLAMTALLGLVLAILSQTRWSPFDRYAHLDSVDAAEALRSEFKSAKQLKFRSWDGVWQGTDNDTELTLLPDGTVTITHFGYGVASVTGTYSTDGPLVLVNADFSNLVGVAGAEDWPPLRLKTDGTDLLLVPDRKTTALSRSDDWFLSRAEEWPLRRIE